MGTENRHLTGVADVGAHREETDQTTAAGSGAEEFIQSHLEALGLSGYEARVLLALLRLGSASANELSQASGVNRTSTYPVLDQLSARGLAQALPGKTAIWISVGAEEVLSRLLAAQEDHLRELQTRSEQAREVLARMVAASPSPLPYVHILRGSAQVKKTYEALLAGARHEVLVYNRPPYTWKLGRVNAAIMDALARHVGIRVLYQAAQLYDPAAEGFRQEIAVYHDAGVQGRVIDDVPMKLAVADRQRALLTMFDGAQPQGYPTTLLVENAGFAAAQAAGFEHYWQGAKAVTEVGEL